MESRFKFSSICLDLFSCHTFISSGRRRAFPTRWPLVHPGHFHSSGPSLLRLRFGHQREKPQLHYSFGSFQCWTCWETWPAAFWRARADLLLPFLDGDFFLRGSVEGSSCPPSSSSSSSFPFFLFLLITSSPWKNLRGGGNEEDPEGCGTDVSRTAPILIERLWIGMSSSGWWVELRRDGNRITG